MATSTTKLTNPLNSIQFKSNNSCSHLLRSAQKLRAYEVSKLKYYFAIGYFKSSAAADKIYAELDGIELEHSSCAIDVRAIPEEDLSSVTGEREQKDFCNSVPENYDPPDFIAKALQQSSVKCTWEDGDVNRDKMLTSWGLENETWKAMSEGDDMKAYLASDSDDSDDSSDGGDEEGGAEAEEKKREMRRMLLGSDAESSDGGEMGVDEQDDFFTYDNDGVEGEGGDRDGDGDGEDYIDKEMTVTFNSSTTKLEEKLRQKKLDKKRGADGEETATLWERYQQKRKEKRRERKQKLKKKDNYEGERTLVSALYMIASQPSSAALIALQMLLIASFDQVVPS